MSRWPSAAAQLAAISTNPWPFLAGMAPSLVSLFDAPVHGGQRRLHRMVRGSRPPILADDAPAL